MNDLSTEDKEIGLKRRRFEIAVERLLALEGGYRDDPDDPGGETKYGISKRWYPELNIKDLTKEQAIEIYKTDWWDRYRYSEIEGLDLASKLLDMAVNQGPGTAHVQLQLATNRTGPQRLKIDGIIGPKTLAAVNNHPDQKLLLCALKLEAVEMYADINNPKFLRGWIKRALS